MKNTALILVGLMLGVSSLAAAQQGWRTDTLNSRALGRRPIYVATPPGYGESKERYPILVLLDANDEPLFRLWIAQAVYLTSNSSGVPPMIAVGIPNGDDRIHDMTPPATGASVKGFPNAGGAAAFADFILGEVLPHILAKHRALPNSVFLVGHSAGGLFAIDVAARRPSAFKGIVATSPAIWFNDGTLPAIYAELIDEAQTRPRIFFSSANEGTLTAACQRLADLLGANSSMKDLFIYRHYPELTHQLTPMSVGDGLRFIFDPLSLNHLAIARLDFANLDSVSLRTALRSSDSSYAAAARSYGLPDQLPERVINSLGYRLLDRQKARLAVSVFQRNVRDFPESVNVYDSLADGFLAAGDSALALTQLRAAVRVARETGVAVPAETQTKLAALEARKSRPK